MKISLPIYISANKVRFLPFLRKKGNAGDAAGFSGLFTGGEIPGNEDKGEKNGLAQGVFAK